MKWSRRGADLGQRLADHSSPATNGCIEWTAGRDKDGYGKIQVSRRARRTHQIAWEVANGTTPPAGTVVRHRCDNPPCINPDHLVLGDAQLNAEDRVQRGRFNRESPRYNRVRLSMDAAREIRRKHARGMTQAALAAFYGVGRDQISRVVNNRNWKEAA